ncbi:hypothetical protein ACJMK2_016776 [Sinanodonta woodiana]|uniref:DUF5745 domain-containing protein n=1 Tax=Sinanodonta woodiana TaxID=1069815 RepID=A0ABD3UUT4_SINWO
MDPKGISFLDEDAELVHQVNKLLEQLNSVERVKTVDDIGASVFVTFFEGLCGEQLHGKIKSPITKEDEIHNCQLVIDSLANDVLHTPLDHISGVDIVEGCRDSKLNLVEIISGLLEYILNKIDSDIASDDEEDGRSVDLENEDLDRMTSVDIDKILESELLKEKEREIEARWKAPISAVWQDETSPVKSKVPAPPAEGTRNTTIEQIAEGKAVERKLQSDEKSKWTQSSPIKVTVESRKQGPSQPYMHQETVLHDRTTKTDILRRIENDPRYRYTIPGLAASKPSTSASITGAERPVSPFYSLENLVEETAAMARAAIGASPSTATSLLRNLDSSREKLRSRKIKPPRSGSAERLFCKSPPVLPGAHTAARSSRKDQVELSSKSPAKRMSPSSQQRSPVSDRLSDTELTPSKAKRKVSFLVDRSTTDSSPSFDRGRVRRAWESETSSFQKDAEVNLRTASFGRISSQKASGSYLDDLYGDKENDSYEEKLKRQFHEIIDDVLSDEEAQGQFRLATVQKTGNTRHARQSNVQDTKNLIDEEGERNKKKIGFLQKIYQEDLDEIVDEANYDMFKNRKVAKETENEFKKTVLKPVDLTRKSTKTKTAASVLKKKFKVVPKGVVSTKFKRQTPSKGYMSTYKRPKPWTIEDNEDILPLLMEEFPHLHLSLNTWHELWRKGLGQIEQITRAYQEVKRKKSHAQAQLEEAERRQEIMVNIMKKELEHGQRLKETKERQASTIGTRNKIHERRMQSARSRKYYDDYQVRMRAKMLKRRTREEMIFKKLFKDALEIQKERVRELRKYAQEQRDSQVKHQRNDIESMENYYHDQFEMLAESIAKEKKELGIREKAQQKMMDQMKKELRKKMETEIKQLQDQLVRDDDDAYFRQLDADRVIHDLQMAKYCTKA